MIGSRDLDRFSEFVEGLYVPCGLLDFPGLVLSRFAQIFESKAYNYNRENLGQFDADGNLTIFPSLKTEKLFGEIIPENSSIPEYTWLRSIEGIKIADLVSNSDLHRLEVSYWRSIQCQGMEERKGMIFPDPRDRGTTKAIYLLESDAIYVSISRSQIPLTNRDRVLLNNIRPHLIQAYQNMVVYNQIRQRLNEYDRILERANTIILNLDRQLKFVTNNASDLLNQYFNWDNHDQLPERLDKWLQERISLIKKQHRKSTWSVPLRVTKNELELIIRLDYNFLEPELLIIMQERPKRSFATEDLQNLGLTSRESHILYLISQDLNNQQIANKLNCSPNTIKKHIEQIYTKLNVSSRSAAVMKALNKLGLLQDSVLID